MQKLLVRFGPKANIRGRGWIVRYAPNSNKIAAMPRMVAMCQKRTSQMHLADVDIWQRHIN
jgi:hypothetical protein